jgi:hypothetical protein
LWVVADAVASDVGSDLAGQSRVVIPHGAEVQLHRPTFAAVQLTDMKHDIGGESVLFLWRCRLTTTRFCKDALSLRIGNEMTVRTIQAVKSCRFSRADSKLA